MKTFKIFLEDGGYPVATGAPTTTTAGVSGTGDNPDKTVPVSVDQQKKYVKANKVSQPTLRHRQSKVNMVSPMAEELKYNQEKITKSNSKTEKNPTGFAIGDKGHLGFAIKGGLGFTGKIKKIDGHQITISSAKPNKFGPREFTGHSKRFTKD